MLNTVAFAYSGGGSDSRARSDSAFEVGLSGQLTEI